MPRLATAALVALVLASPFALAAPAPLCDAVTTEGATPVGPYLLPAGNLRHDTWLESNLVPGLQKVECRAADGTVVAPDHHVGVVGIDGGGQPVCAPRLGCVYL